MCFDPKSVTETPSYYCTWATQNYMYGCGADTLDTRELEGEAGARHARDSMNEQMLFGRDGWARCFYPEARSGLYLLLDDGWDVPQEDGAGYTGSLIPDAQRFPTCVGDPSQRLERLNNLAKAEGWRGIGLWVAAQEAPALMGGENFSLTPEQQKAYWVERLTWSRQAGIRYWKVDWGKHAHDPAFRRNLTKWGREVAPDLVIEHACCQGCINDEQTMGETQGLSIRTGRADIGIIEKQRQMFEYADVVRSYDVLFHLSIVQTIERVSRLLIAAQGTTGSCLGLINCEDEVYIAAALGLCAGVMRFPLVGLRPGTDPECFFPASERNVKRCIDEVTRFVHFQQIMPAFGVNDAPVFADDVCLTDTWHFEPGQTWFTQAIGKTVAQSAPARVARGIPLPIVRVQGEPPFVLASRHPNGSVAVATLGRTLAGRGYFKPEADVTLELIGKTEHVGVFGEYACLRLAFSDHMPVKILARDLCGGKEMDITGSVTYEGGTIVIPGNVLHQIGLDQASPEDESEPGLLLMLL